jgi:hypothetical protein
MVQDGLGKKQNLISKITSETRAGGEAQAVVCLPSKHEALSLSLRTNKKIFKTVLTKKKD